MNDLFSLDNAVMDIQTFNHLLHLYSRGKVPQLYMSVCEILNREILADGEFEGQLDVEDITHISINDSYTGFIISFKNVDNNTLDNKVIPTVIEGIPQIGFISLQ